MKIRFSPIILTILILSLAMQTIALPALAQSEPNISQTEIEVSDTLPENRLVSYPDQREAQLYPEDLFENIPPELGELYQRHSESDERPAYIPPSPEIIEKTQEQLNNFNCILVTVIPQIECLALVAFYGSTNGAGWEDNTNWLQNNTVSTWHGVSIVMGRVIQLDLTNNQLNGSIPAELSNLSNLRGLYLGNNQLTGSIPSSLGNLSNLMFFILNGNQLTGSIPSILGDLSNLEALYLNNNQLTGSIPLSFVTLTKLFTFNFSETMICEPATDEFLTWKETVSFWNGTGVTCGVFLPLLFR